MKRITRREVLRWLGGVSALGALGQGINAVSKPRADTGTRSLALEKSPLTTEPGSSTPSTTRQSPSGSTTVAENHQDHIQSTAGPSTSEHISTTAAPATSDTVASSTQATDPSTTSSGATDPQTHDTTSTAPAVAAGTIELSGTIPPTIVPVGQVATIVGDLNLQGDLLIEGVLTGVSFFTLEGNGHQIEVRNGGQVDLQGVPKSGWVRGVNPSGWQAGDRILTAPIGAGRYGAGDFHAGSPEVMTLADGRTIAAEQFNLTRSIVINNVSRLMFHHGAGRQVLKHLAVTNSGVSGEIGFYPIHFHKNGDTTRGSIVEGVVVENGRFHAVVPHASHGITFLDCVAYNTTEHAYWWDSPPSDGDTSNDTRDVVWQHCLAAVVTSPSSAHRLAAFVLGASSGNRCIDCTAVAVQGGKNSSGFVWPEKGHGVWEFRGCVGHNNEANGLFVWQNTAGHNQIADFIAYRCGRAGVEHGAYVNNFKYVNLTISDAASAVISHALSGQDGLVFDRVVTNGALVISKHSRPSSKPVVYNSCRFAKVVFQETVNGESDPGIHELVDTGLQPESIDVSAIHPDTVIRILAGGQLQAQWSAGIWQ